MADKNENYVFESDEADFKDRKILRTCDEEVADDPFTINQLEAKIVRIKKNQANKNTEFDAEIAKFQKKIDEATAALTPIEE